MLLLLLLLVRLDVARGPRRGPIHVGQVVSLGGLEG